MLNVRRLFGHSFICKLNLLLAGYGFNCSVRSNKILTIKKVTRIFCAPIDKTTTEAIKHFMLVALVVLYFNSIPDKIWDPLKVNDALAQGAYKYILVYLGMKRNVKGL